MEYSAIISQFSQTLLTLALPILAAYLAQSLKNFLVAKVADIKANASTETTVLIDGAIQAGVQAAEQLYTGSGQGKAKLAYATELATAYLSKLGVQLDLALLTGLIEAEVHRAFSE